ncbi:hypothetical protein SELR_12470 [Selenomonas ruminantium subsp. lactilytica TAM6421]|uniref:Uncharacterized protein n=1 Tax=Selenomonas ruminantium subsp. lactilytica (strain NBRC 103574 / TAM6421) TaxID=927704 RepID=I0GQB8_SELRL|nr:hypothetical protein SELR_12470 [Selenomonas ruminantium subsp. lactilytica TAM6421]
MLLSVKAGTYDIFKCREMTNVVIYALTGNRYFIGVVI